MTRWMHPPELDRERKRDHFDPVVEGARHALARELSLAIWDRVCADATDSAGRRDMEQAQQRFHELAARIAARGGRLRPDVGRVTRVGVELNGDSRGPWNTDELRPRVPGRETLFAVEARRWSKAGDAAPAEADQAMGRRELPGASEVARAMAALQTPPQPHRSTPPRLVTDPNVFAPRPTAATPPMASYLNVFCAGELEMLSARLKNVDHGVITTKNKVVMGRYALDCSQEILSYFNDYFGIPYPLPKLHHVAVPGGFGGAMENWGGITYYESRLLFDPGSSSAETKQGIYAVIAHETAHMWFGDLVTMAWWDNLWLNEGFASWMGNKCTAKFNPDWEVWLSKNVPRDPTRRHGIGKEAAMEGDARSTTHPIQQPIANEAEANSAFDDITYRKGMSFITMLESFLGEEVFRDGIRQYMAAHKLSNTTTADLWNSLSKASGKPVVEIAAAWTEQPGFPVVNVTRNPSGKITLTQERFTVNFPNAPTLEWKIPLTYSIAGEAAPVSLLMTSRTIDLPGVPAGHAVKLNVGGAGNYRVHYDEASWKLLLADLPKLAPADRVNLLSDAWALVQANRAPLSLYLDLIEKLPAKDELAEREQIMLVFDFINRLLAGEPQRDQFQKYARSILRSSFDQVGWEPKKGEPIKIALLRGSLIKALGDLSDEEIVAGCRDRFQKYLADPRSLAPDLRQDVLAVVGRYADDGTWNKLHELGLKTTSIEAKQNYYDALAAAIDPKLAARTLKISLGDELPTSRAIYLVAKVGRQSEHPEVAWQFAKANMKKLLAKTDALAANSYAPGLFTFFSDAARIAELERYAKSDLPPTSAKAVTNAIDEVSFHAEIKSRLLSQMAAWTSGPATKP
jgi:aminopeptidase N